LFILSPNAIDTAVPVAVVVESSFDWSSLFLLFLSFVDMFV
jgi:hypothetical protein